jgi:hypothetical protein
MGDLTGSHRTEILVATIGLVGVLGAALIGNWDKVFPPDGRTDGGAGASPAVPSSQPGAPAANAAISPSPPGTQNVYFFCAREAVSTESGAYHMGCSAIQAFAVPWNGRSLEDDRVRSLNSDRFWEVVEKSGIGAKIDSACVSQGYELAVRFPLKAWTEQWRRGCR